MKQLNTARLKELPVFSFKILVFLLIGVSNAFAINYDLNFGTPQDYVNSLSNIRSGVGQAVDNISIGSAHVYRLSQQETSVNREGVIITITGIDFYGDESTMSTRLVLDPTNLYVTGFINQNVYYQFSDAGNVTLPETYRVVTLQNGSSYTDLQRIANLSRVGMSINRSNLIDGRTHLSLFNSTSLDQQTARALLRYITVVSEAIRFRQLQRGIRMALNPIPTDYQMNDDDVYLTLNWARLSTMLPLVEEGAATGIRTGNIFLPDTSAILYSLAVVLNCRTTMVYKADDNKCLVHSSTVINNIAWDKDTLSAAIHTLTE